MTTIKLTRLNEANFDKLYEMISAMKDFLDEDPDTESKEWIDNLNAILDFQDDDGSFKLLSSYNIPSDARVEFCHMPTYICTSILMKAYLLGGSSLDDKVNESSLEDKADESSLEDKADESSINNKVNESSLFERIEDSLIRGLEMSTLRKLTGHGYESLEGQIEAMNIFMKGGLREFIDLYPEMNPEFTDMILNITNQFSILEAEEKFQGPWGKSYRKDILKINKYFNSRKVFVYGTLMKGQYNHHYLQNSELLGASTVEGYEMYSVEDYYPAIIPGDERIIGELYEVPQEDMEMIDMLEGEGSLYMRKCEMTSDKSIAYIYEYLQDTSDLEKINSWKDYIWYVSYGSNMLYERFMTYIEGGSFEKGGSYNYPCEDTSAPIEKRSIEIPYDMYFGNHSGSWYGCGVSFLDTSRKGHALGVAYLITPEQFEHVAAEENGGRFPDGRGNWYEDIENLGKMDGFDMITITNNELSEYNKPCEEYLITLKRGIRQNWPDMTEDEIDEYLDSCIRG